MSPVKFSRAIFLCIFSASFSIVYNILIWKNFLTHCILKLAYYLCSPFVGKENYFKVKTKNYITKTVSPAEVKRDWILVDAENQVLGRLATKISMILQGKTKTMYTPNIDTGDHVIVINAEKVKLTGNKMNDKQYIRHTTYPGGQRVSTPREVLAKKPEFIIENAVKHMLPRTKMGREMYRKLHVFAGENHPHEAQQPKKIKL